MAWFLTVWVLCGLLAFFQRLYDDWCDSPLLILDVWDVLYYVRRLVTYLPCGAVSLVWVNWSK